MKLRNKKTGVIYKIEDIDLGNNADGIWLGMSKYNSLAEFNAEWEDYDKPKEYWFLSTGGEPHRFEGEDKIYTPNRKSIGNYFDTREEAEKAVEKLKAWKRLKDKGFVFNGINEDDGTIKTGLLKGVSLNDCEEFYCDMELLFGGEE